MTHQTTKSQAKRLSAQMSAPQSSQSPEPAIRVTEAGRALSNLDFAIDRLQGLCTMLEDRLAGFARGGVPLSSREPSDMESSYFAMIDSRAVTLQEVGDRLDSLLQRLET